MALGTIWTFTRSHTFCKSRTTSFTFQSEIPSSSLVRYCIVFRVFFTNYCQLIYSLEYDIAFDLSLYIFIDIGFKNFWTLLKAGGIPQPLIHWFKGRTEVIPSNHIGIFNDGTELRISNVKQSDLGAYSCVAKNSEGNLTQFTKLVQAGNLTFSHG
jgi:hypothetical protein